ncbi:MAG TPA: gephyrin-like molybdotransferase Glp [Capillimicrobium sp.]|jgi:molybdopterin molybdotransferase
MADLLSIAEARAIIAAAVPGPPAAEEVAVEAALGLVLAEEVASAHAVPPFASSAMDGYAVRSGPAGRRLAVVDEARAGHPAARAVGDGEAIAISTGAPLPEGADGVLQVELVERDGDTVTLAEAVEPGRNVRPAGDDLRPGTVLLRPGTRLGPAELGVAVHAGRAALRCAVAPRVAVVSTGDELVDAGEPLGPGQIHNSNATTLASLALEAGADVFGLTGVPDTLADTEQALGDALEEADVVLVSGGVSVGPHDHVKPALEALGVEQLFWRVALRPGKPTWFGRRGGQLVFGLPGNPVSSMVTFLLFARPALLALQGAPFAPARRTAILAEAVERNAQRDEAVRVRLATDEDGRLTATPTGPQGSHILSSMLAADGLALVERGEGELAAGSPVAVEPI